MPDTNHIRKSLHQYLEVADDKKVKALYAIMEKDIEESSFEYSDEFKAELDSRYKKYKTGESLPVTAEESMERIKRILKSDGK